MFDLGWSELLVIGIVALIVVGPKDLPRMLRTLGQYAARARSVAREFQRSMDEAARQADLDELRQVKKDLDKEAAGIRDGQYKLQREMSQSVIGKPMDKAPAPTPGDGAARPADAEAPRSEAPRTAPAPSASPASPAGRPAAEPQPRSGKVGGT